MNTAGQSALIIGDTARLSRGASNEVMREDGDVVKGMAAGLLGGLAASAVMLGFQRLWADSADRLGRPDLKPGAMFDRRSEPGEKRPDDPRPNSSEAAAQKITRLATGRMLGRREERIGGLIGHFAYGGAMGALYGALAGSRERSVALGIGFGLAVYVFDQFLLPAAGLSEYPQEAPASTQAFGASNHVVYGATMELVRAGLRAA